MSRKAFYITTPIYYVNDVPHIGHGYSTIIADVMARYKRFTGYDVLFLTGTDEHGQKVEKAALEKGLSPQEHSDRMVEPWQSLWAKLNISYDDFIRTTQERHIKVVQSIFEALYDKGDIYKGLYEGWYCVHEETFYPESQLVGGCCPECSREVEWLKEESYYFRTSKYQEALLAHINENPDFVQPDFRRNEVLSFMESGVQDISVSRTTFQWGIPVPFDSKHIIYVWFDALINYITGSGYLQDEEKYRKYWPADIHVIGKDIIRFHAVIWPIMLLALGVELPKKVLATGFWTLGGEKISKSKGIVVDPNQLIDEFGEDTIRYFLLREIGLGLDGEFTKDAVVRRINGDLANDLGNLVHRTVAMMMKYFEGAIPEAGEFNPIDADLKNEALSLAGAVEEAMGRIDIREALVRIWKVVGKANKYIDEAAPWALAREGQTERLETVMRTLLETIRIVALHLTPVMPKTAAHIWDQLGQEGFETLSFEDTKNWGGLASGTSVKKAPPLFPRIEIEEDK
ncbi:MAG: methionine--tRNA ligase [Actinomycetota bacterium]|nr:methionine--tRNA ligase [Actinomycetota bacterium]